MSVKATLKIILQADDTIVAESEDAKLWQNVLIAINQNNNNSVIQEPQIEGDPEVSLLNKERDPVENFATYIGVETKKVQSGMSPVIKEPYIYLDKHHWESIKKNLPERGTKAIPDVVIVATLLLVWKEHLKLGDTTSKEVVKILSDFGITAKNPKRSYENCAWIQIRNGNLIINPAQISKAKLVTKAYCEMSDISFSKD